MKKKTTPPPPDHHESEEMKFLREMKREMERRGEEIADNISNLTRQVNNGNVRIIVIERILLERASAKDVLLTQILGGDMSGVLQVLAGGPASVFAASLIPANGKIQGQLQYAADDPSVVLVPATDGMSVSAAAPATDTNPIFQLTVSGIGDDGTPAGLPFKHVFSVTINPAAPPPPVPATDVDLTQVS